MSLNHKLKQQLSEHKAQEKAAEAAVGVPDQEQTITVPVPEEASTDPLMNAGAVGGSEEASEQLHQIAGQGEWSTDDDTVDVEPEDKDSFLDALVTGERFTRPFSLFNGKVAGVFRCRSSAESAAISRYLNRKVINKVYETTIEYGTAVRTFLLAAQVQEYNGIVFDPLPAPLDTMVDSKGELVDPAWVSRAEYWSSDKVPEAVVAAVYAQLQYFERLYWTMVVNANNQNFWKTATSI